MHKWAVITGAGTGIGASLTKHLARKGINVLAIGKRFHKLKQISELYPEKIHPFSTDITTKEGIEKISEAVPKNEKLIYLVQNAAIGIPEKLGQIQRSDFENAISVNVTAPLMLTQKLLPHLSKSNGRILHIGTNVAFNPQIGTATYGVTKMAFHRLYEQLKVDLKGTGVSIGSARPGIVDTEGLRNHLKLARAVNLPHVAYFDSIKQKGEILISDYVAKFLAFLLEQTDKEEFSAKEWSIKDETHHSRWN